MGRLEPRVLLSLNIEFDYTYDSNHFFDTQAKKDVLNAAANAIVDDLSNTLSAIAPGGGNTWSPVFFNPSNPGQNVTLANPSIPADTIVIYVGASVLGGTEAGLGGFGGFSGASGSSAWIKTVQTRGESGTPAPFAPWGGSISFDDSAGTSWYFGTTASGLQPSQTDFFTIAEHEIGHVLGIGTSPRWSAQISNGSFDGPAAEAAHGNQPVPVDSKAAHFAEGTMSVGQVAVMTPVLSNGTRRNFTPLDFAALEDLGWQVQARSTTTSIAGPSTYSPVRGQTMTLYAAVSASAPGSSAPTGTVSFKYGSTLWATEPLVTANGLTYAAMPTAPMPMGTYTVTTVYNGDAGDLPSQSSMTFTVGKDATTTVVAPSDFAPTRGESVFITAVVSVNAPGAGAPTGTVSFMSGSVVVATEPILTSGTIFYARIPAVPFSMGNYAITAVYNGDAGDTSSSSTTNFTVGPDVTSTVAVASPTAPVQGQAVTLTAAVNVAAPGAGLPTGTITFKDGSAVLGTGSLKIINGIAFATFTDSTLSVGSHSITASYGGDAGDKASASAAFTLTVSASSGRAAQGLTVMPVIARAVATEPPVAPASPILLAESPPTVGMSAASADRAWLAAIEALDSERAGRRG